jgi:hypothetical protein
VGLKQAAKAAGISLGTLRRAADALGVERAKQPGVANGPWLWRLPAGTPRRADDDGDGDGKANMRTVEGAQVRTFDPSADPAVGAEAAGGEGGAQRADADEGDSPARAGRSEGAQVGTLTDEHLPGGGDLLQETLL